MIRRYPNGATQCSEAALHRQGEPTRGTEISKYPQEKKTSSDSPGSGERRGKSPNRRGYGPDGVVGPLIRNLLKSNDLGRSAVAGDSPVDVRAGDVVGS